MNGPLRTAHGIRPTTQVKHRDEDLLTRNDRHVESGLVLWASRKLGCPVKYTSTRSEVFLTDFQGRDLLTRVALAIRADGKFLGLRADNVSNIGARCASLSPLSKGSALVTGSYN